MAAVRGAASFGVPGIRRALALTVGGNTVSMGLSFSTGILAARLLGPEGRGQLAAIQVWPQLLAMLAIFGLDSALVYFGNRKGAELGRLTGTAVAIGLSLSLALVPIGYAAIPLALPAQEPWVVDAARLFLLYPPLAVLAGLPYGLWQARKAFGWWNALRLYPNAAFFLLLLVATATHVADPRFLVLGVLGFLVLLLPVEAVLLRNTVAGPWWPRRELARPLLWFGCRATLASIPQYVNIRLDQLVMAAVLPAEELGLYAAAVAWSNAGLPLAAALASVLYPNIAGAESVAAARAMLARYLLPTAAVVLATGLAVLGAAPVAIPLLFGQSFTHAVPPALVLGVGGMALGLNRTLEDGLNGVGAPGSVARAQAVGAVVTVLLLVALVPPYRAMGAAVASTVAYSLVTGVLLAEAHRTLRLRPGDVLSAALGPGWRSRTTGA